MRGGERGNFSDFPTSRVKKKRRETKPFRELRSLWLAGLVRRTGKWVGERARVRKGNNG